MNLPLNIKNDPVLKWLTRDENIKFIQKFLKSYAKQKYDVSIIDQNEGDIAYEIYNQWGQYSMETVRRGVGMKAGILGRLLNGRHINNNFSMNEIPMPKKGSYEKNILVDTMIELSKRIDTSISKLKRYKTELYKPTKEKLKKFHDKGDSDIRVKHKQNTTFVKNFPYLKAKWIRNRIEK